MIEDGSLRIGRFIGIPLKLHWTFGLLVILVLYATYAQNSLWFLCYVVFLFTSVVLHEYGHAFAAKKFGVNTRDIILSPIGGVARLENLPDKPKHEMIIAFAGPLVNAIIVFLIALGLLAAGENRMIPYDLDNLQAHTLIEFFQVVLLINGLLFVFNLIPAFPMDGGRILRSGLAIYIGKTKATRIASAIGRILAFGFIGYGLYFRAYTLAFIGVVVILMATREMRDILVTEKLSKIKVRDYMRSFFTLLHFNEPMSKAFDIFQKTGETHFFITNGLGELVGTLPGHVLLQALSQQAGNQNIEEWYVKKISVIEADDSLLHALEKLNATACGILLVTDRNKTENVIDKDAIIRAMNIQS